MKYYVYIYEDPVTNEPFYIGKGCNDRAYVHLSESYSETLNRKKWAKIKSIRNKGFEPVVKFHKYFDDEDEAYNEEANLIKQYGRKGIDSDGILTNICADNRPPVPHLIQKKQNEK